MTEDEMKTKWCPMVRYVPARKFSFGHIVSAINRWIDADDEQKNPRICNCIGSDCAMWVDEGKQRYGVGDKVEMKRVGRCGLVR